MKFLKIGVKDCLKPWVLMELCLNISPCMFFGTLVFGRPQREPVMELLLFWLFGGFVQAVVNLVSYFSIYFFLDRAFSDGSDKQYLLFVCYISCLSFCVDCVLSFPFFIWKSLFSFIRFINPGLFEIFSRVKQTFLYLCLKFFEFCDPSMQSVAIWIFEWILSACFAFLACSVLQIRMDTVRKINGIFWKITRFGCYAWVLSCLLLLALLIRFCFSSGR